MIALVSSGVPYQEIHETTGIPKKTSVEWASATPGVLDARRMAVRMRVEDRERSGRIALDAAVAATDSARDVVRDVGLAAVMRGKELLPLTDSEQAPTLISAGARAVALAEGWAAKEQATLTGGVLLAIQALFQRLVERGALPAEEAERERRLLLEAGKASEQSGQVVKVYIGRDLREAIR